MHDLDGTYARHFNAKYGLKGHLWDERFYAFPLDSEEFIRKREKLLNIHLLPRKPGGEPSIRQVHHAGSRAPEGAPPDSSRLN